MSSGFESSLFTAIEENCNQEIPKCDFITAIDILKMLLGKAGITEKEPRGKRVHPDKPEETNIYKLFKEIFEYMGYSFKEGPNS